MPSPGGESDAVQAGSAKTSRGGKSRSYSPRMPSVPEEEALEEADAAGVARSGVLSDSEMPVRSARSTRRGRMSKGTSVGSMMSLGSETSTGQEEGSAEDLSETSSQATFLSIDLRNFRGVEAKLMWRTEVLCAYEGTEGDDAASTASPAADDLEERSEEDLEVKQAKTPYRSEEEGDMVPTMTPDFSLAPIAPRWRARRGRPRSRGCEMPAQHEEPALLDGGEISPLGSQSPRTAAASEGSLPRQDSSVLAGEGFGVPRLKSTASDMSAASTGALQGLRHQALGCIKGCIKCGSRFRGFGPTCGACRRIGERGCVQHCQQCQVFFTGYGAFCDGCQKAQD